MLTEKEILPEAEHVLLGMNLPRIDGIERVTGRGKYCADWKIAGMVYARPIMSGIPHGIVKKIDLSKLAELEGVVATITCLDDDTVWNAGERVHKRRVFTEHVRFVGDAIGAVAAISRNKALEALDLIKVEYEELPAVLTLKDALKPDSPKIWEDGNFLGPIVFGFGDIESAFARADLIVEGDYSTSRVHNCPLEPATSLAWWEDDKLTVVAATQNVTGCRDGIARDLNIPVSNVRVITRYKGGGFGNKNNSMNHDLMAALLAKKTARPVMMEYSRADDFIGVHGRWSSNQYLRAAIDKKNGRILAINQKAYCDVGGYTRHVTSGMFVDGGESYYSTDAWKGEVYAVYTNTSATGHMRAPTGPQACFAAETLIDEIAYKLDMDPLEFRLRNYVRKFEAVKEFTSNGMEDCLLSGAKAFGWKARWHKPLPSNPDRKKALGVGVAMSTWHSRHGKGEAIVRLRKDGILDVATSVVDIGTGAKSVMAIIAADTLGIPLDKVNVIWGDSDSGLYSIGESGSRTTNFTGTAVKDAALKLRTKIILIASNQLKVEPSDLGIRDGKIYSLKKAGILLGLDEFLARTGLEQLEERSLTNPSVPEDLASYSFAAHFAEVEVDLETGQISVASYLGVHDSGPIVNKLLSTSQVQGGVIMGIGMALSEQLLINPDYGTIQNSSLYSYRLPNIVSIPKIEALFVQTKDPYGTKSLGETTIVPVPAAIGNAIFNATGIRLRDLPFTPERFLRASNKLAL